MADNGMPITWATVPEGGRLLGLNTARSYEAARGGYLDTVQVSKRRYICPLPPLAEKLDMTVEEVRSLIRAMRVEGEVAA